MNPLAGPAGPGKYSTRTDNLQMGSIAYGEGVETAAIKSGAPLAKTPNVRPQPMTELYAPTQRPEEPATTGIDMGAGAGSEILALRKPDDTNFVAALTSYKPVLNFIADQPNTSPETRAAIRQLWDSL
jgi:hypothetical protein